MPSAPPQIQHSFDGDDTFKVRVEMSYRRHDGGPDQSAVIVIVGLSYCYFKALKTRSRIAHVELGFARATAGNIRYTLVL